MQNLSTASKNRHAALSCAFGVWLVVCGGIAWASMSYSHLGYDTRQSNGPPQIENTQLRFPAGATAVVLCVEPKCRCTLATIRELAKVLEQIPESQKPRVAVVVSSGADLAGDSDLVRAARRELPDAEIHFDATGSLLGQLEVQTSGTVLVFTPAGEAVFRGGITIARGHTGANPATEALRKCLTGHGLELQYFPAYGCQLRVSNIHVEKGNAHAS